MSRLSVNKEKYRCDVCQATFWHPSGFIPSQFSVVIASRDGAEVVSTHTRDLCASCREVVDAFITRMAHEHHKQRTGAKTEAHPNQKPAPNAEEQVQSDIPRQE